jgi:hypothetical protein
MKRPPKLLELILSALLPEEVLGDLQQRYRSLGQYLLDLTTVVPVILMIQLKQFGNWKVIFAVLVAFLIGLVSGISFVAGPAALHNAVPFLLLLSLWIVLMIGKLASRPQQ